MSTCVHCGPNFEGECAHSTLISAKWVLRVGATSLAATTLYALLLALALEVVFGIAQTYIPSIGIPGLDLALSGGALTILVGGLGGTVLTTFGSTYALAASVFLASIAISLWLWLRKAQIAINSANPLSWLATGASSSIGVGVPLVLAGTLVGNLQVDGYKVTVGWAIALIAALAIGFVASPKPLAHTVDSFIGIFLKPFGNLYKLGFKFFRFATWILIFWLTLAMGTGLIMSWPVWAWIVLIPMWILLAPNLSAMLLPVYFGVPLVASSTVLGYVNASEGFNSWVRWVILAASIVTALTVLIRESSKQKSSAHAWWSYPLFGLAVGAVGAWLFSTHLSGSSASWYSLLSLGGGFAVSEMTGPNIIYSSLLAGAIGLAYGILRHPVFEKLRGVIDNSFVVRLAGVGRGLVEIATLRRLAVVRQIRSAFNRQPKSFQQIARVFIGSVVATGLFFLAQPIANLLAPLYQSEHYAEPQIIAALKSGDSKTLKQFYPSVLKSTGLGEQAEISISHLSDEDHRVVKWATGYLDVASSRSTSKPAFLTFIPQWDEAITRIGTPTLSIRANGHEVANIDIDGKSVPLVSTLLIPGEASVRAGVDDTGFLTSTAAKAIVGRDRSVSVTVSLRAKSAQALVKAVSTAIKPTIDYSCDKATNQKFGTAFLGAWDPRSDLPSLVSSGTGVCYYKDVTTGETQSLKYSFKATGKYSNSNHKWIWSFLFR